MNAVKIRSLIREQKRTPLLNKINLWSIVDQTAVGVDLQMSAGLELFNLPDISMKEMSEIDGYQAFVKKLLHAVPEETTLQFVIQVREGDPERVKEFVDTVSHNDALGDFGQAILKAKEQFMKEKFIQKKRSVLFLTTYPPEFQRPAIRLASLKEIKPGEITRELHEVRIRQLDAAVKSLTDSLAGLGIKSKRLDDAGMADYFYRHLNPKRSRQIDRPAGTFSGVTARSVLALSAAENRLDGLVVDGAVHKTINLLGLPEAIHPHDLLNMTNNLWPDYDICLAVHCVNSERMIERLKKSANVTKALSFSNFGSRYEAEQKFAELEELIREIRSTTQKLFTFSFALLVKGPDERLAEENATLGVKAFQDIGSAIGVVDNLNHEDLFLSFLPNHSHLNHRRHVIHTGPLANLIPLSGSWKGTKIPKVLFENPQGELVNMDLFDPSLPSKHALLIGSTGSGKSFTTNYLLTNFLIESEINHVVIIDIGGSYRKLCQLFDGQYLSVDLTDAYAFNPLPERDGVFDGKEYDPDILAYTILILGRMILDEGEVLNGAGESLLENALKRTYRTGGSPTLKDIRSYLQNIEGNEETKSLAAHYANNLEMWTEGRYSRIFNTSKRLAVDNRLIVFDLEKLGHHPRLQSVYFYVIREIIDAKLRAKALKKMIVIDEGWRFFNDDVGSRLIENLYRTARKSNGMILSISQSPVDFLNTKAANAIISNTYVKYVLRLTKGHEHLPQFGFSTGEIEAIKHLHSVPRQFSDVFLKFVEQATTIRIEPSPLDYWVCTTDADDTVKEQKIRDAHPEWIHSRVLEELVRESQKEAKNS